MLESVEWGEFRIGDLFEIQNTLSFNKDKLTDGFEYDYVTRTSQNQGILQETGFVNQENINPSGTWSLGLLQMDFFYRQKPWYAGQFVRKVIPKIELTKSAILYLTTLLNKEKKNLLSGLVRDVDKAFINAKIQLPVKNGKINFSFMEKFIAELEAEHLAELEAYLVATGLKDYTLTAEEQKALDEFDGMEWGEFRIGDLFEKVMTNKLPFKASQLTKEPTDMHVIPCLTSSFQNQGLNYYAPKEKATILKNVISIPSNSDVYRAYFQSREFTVLSDAYAISWIFDDVNLSPNQYLFTVPCINKVTDLQIYSYKTKLGGWNVVKDKNIELPIKNNQPDYKTMETFISAIQKLVIKDVVMYSENKIAATKKVVSGHILE